MTTIVQESNIGGSGTFPCFVIYTARSEFEFGIRLDGLPKKNVPSTDSDESSSGGDAFMQALSGFSSVRSRPTLFCFHGQYDFRLKALALTNSPSSKALSQAGRFEDSTIPIQALVCKARRQEIVCFLVVRNLNPGDFASSEVCSLTFLYQGNLDLFREDGVEQHTPRCDLAERKQGSVFFQTRSVWVGASSTAAHRDLTRL